MSDERTYGGYMLEELEEMSGRAIEPGWIAVEQADYAPGTGLPMAWREIRTPRGVVASLRFEHQRHNATIIAASRNALPDLVARVRELEARLEDPEGRALELASAAMATERADVVAHLRLLARMEAKARSLVSAAVALRSGAATIRDGGHVGAAAREGAT